MCSLHFISQLKSFSHSSQYAGFRYLLLHAIIYIFSADKKIRVSIRLGNTSTLKIMLTNNNILFLEYGKLNKLFRNLFQTQSILD